MKTKLTVALLAASVAACTREAPPPSQPPPVAVPAQAPVAAPAPAAPAPAAAPAEAAKSAPVTAPKPAAAPIPAAKPAAKPAPTPEATPAAAPTMPGPHAKVGDAKCRMCHRLQHDSWSASPHAAKGLDCEGCHGGGADFVKVMRDRTAALAAGLMLPKKDFCRRCHKADWQDAMLLRVHAHKAK